VSLQESQMPVSYLHCIERQDTKKYLVLTYE
jgi:hypothetical protein